MPLTLEELQEVTTGAASELRDARSLAVSRRAVQIQADAMADDVTIDFEKMQLWSKEEATEFFECMRATIERGRATVRPPTTDGRPHPVLAAGGTTVPGAPPPAAPTPPPPPPPHPKLPRASDEDFKAWFPIAAKENKQNPKFRIVAFHNAGSVSAQPAKAFLLPCAARPM